MANLFHLATGSEMPALKQGVLRLYSMVFCPYAQRTRLVLAAKNIPHETININLVKKPEWFLKLNPGGLVPCIQLDETRCIPESLICSEYIDVAYGGEKLIPADPYTNAIQKLHIERFAKVIARSNRAMKGSDDELIKKLVESLSSFNNSINGNFLGGSKPAFVDYMIWPWLERLETIQKMKKFTLDRSKFGKLFAYVERMKQTPAVQQTLIQPEDHMAFYESFLAKKHDYDILWRKSKL